MLNFYFLFFLHFISYDLITDVFVIEM